MDKQIEVHFPALVLTELDEWLLTYEEKGAGEGVCSRPIGWYKTPKEAVATIEDFLAKNPGCNFALSRTQSRIR